MSDIFIEAVTSIVDNVLAGKAFPTVCRIVSYDPETQRATVSHTVRGVLNDGTPKKREDIPDVPIFVYGMGRYSSGSNPQVGDTVFCVFAGRNIAAFKATKTVADQDDGRILNFNDGVGFVFDISRVDALAVFDFGLDWWTGTRDGKTGIRITEANKIFIGSGDIDLVGLISDLGNKVSELSKIVETLGVTGTMGVAVTDPASITIVKTFRTGLDSVINKIDSLKT